jgi:hypothetical protein
MPNWVFTTASVHGSAAKIVEFREKARQPYNTYYEDWQTKEVKEQQREGDLLFWNFVQPENKQAYFGDAHGTKPEGYESWSSEKRLAHDLKFSGQGWYDWNVTNWGTKWEVDATLEQDEPEFLEYRFDTAWSPAEEAFRAMVEQHPDLSFSFYCEEEQGWGVEYDGTDGELTVTKQWDIPDSHAAWEDLDREGSCVCVWDDDTENWYPDCPRQEMTKEELDAIEDLIDAI